MDVLPNVQEELLWRHADETSGQGLLKVIEEELRKALPMMHDRTLAEVDSVVAELERNSSILTFHEAAVRRFRLKEAAARIEAGERESWADLAQKLGYYDQSHLINDFRRMLGRTPALYSRVKT